MKKTSIKFRVTLWFTVFITITASAVFYIMITHRSNQIKDEAERILVKNVEDMAGRLSGEPFMPNGNTDFKPNNRPNSRINVPPGMPKMYGEGVHIAVYNADCSEKAGNIPFEFENMSFEDETVRAITSNNEKYLVYDRKITLRDGTENWVKGVRNISNELKAVNSTASTDLMLILLLIAAAAIGGYYIVRRSLEPVRKISETAKEISNSNDISRRISLGSGKDEIYTLAVVVDEMLDKIQSILEKEKQFTSDASHELRTPVSVILSECEYALDCASSEEEYREALSVIKRQTKKMSGLIAQLLALSRMDKNSFKPSFEFTNISELLETVCDEQTEINRADIILKRSIEKDISVYVDPTLIVRLFINLISNAFQYGKENGTVSVSLFRHNEKTVFSVEDDGIGISEEDLPKIWERFYRASKSRTNEFGNTGLGLAMVKQIAEIHNGTVTAESKQGCGSKFTFVF